MSRAVRRPGAAVSQKPELLAPAGSLEIFTAAVEAGADAVYIGAPAFNARNLARHFSAAEVAAMIDYGHGHGIKVYLAMNSLIKEDEISQACELLALCEGLRPDALIIQDLGLYHLARNFFPSLELHASTLMAAHNSLAVRQMGQMGFARVVLAREMTLAEIETACGQGVEIEVFIHGALCFSYSGLCLFSSYLGGKSGLRGRCVQPCRRRYGWAGKGRGKNGGYLFSMGDLDGLAAVDGLAAAGVASLKIEGRMRSRHYVESVVKGYRLYLDHGKEAEAEARHCLDMAMGRAATRGYFESAQPADALAPHHSGNIGLFLGRVGRVAGEWISVKLQVPVAIGERLRLHQEKSGERHSFTLKTMRSRGETLTGAQAGWKIEIFCPGLSCRSGDSLYKVDVKKGAKGVCPLNAAHFVKQVKQIKKRGVGEMVFQRLGLKEARITGRRGGRKPNRSGRLRRLSLWLQGDSWQLVGQANRFRPERIVLSLNQRTLAQVRRQKKVGRLAKTVVWSLPSVILEEDVAQVSEGVRQLIQAGFYQFQISHLGQLQLFPAGERLVSLSGRRRKDGGIKTRKLVIFGNYTLNILNSLALAACQRLGVGTVTLAVEQDEMNIRRMAKNKGHSSIGLMVYGRPPLFTARLDHELFRRQQPLVSPRGERFVMKREGQATLLMAEEPFSLLSELPALEQIGLDYGVLDVRGLDLPKRGVEQLFQQAEAPAARGAKRRLGTFNYHGTLD